MFSYTRKKQKDGRAGAAEGPVRQKGRSIAKVLASYAANAGWLRRRILRILSPAARARDSL